MTYVHIAVWKTPGDEPCVFIGRTREICERRLWKGALRDRFEERVRRKPRGTITKNVAVYYWAVAGTNEHITFQRLKL